MSFFQGRHKSQALLVSETAIPSRFLDANRQGMGRIVAFCGVILVALVM